MQQIRRALQSGDTDAPNIFGESGLGDGDAVLDKHLRLVEIGTELER